MLAELLSFGGNRRWRRRLVRELEDTRGTILDVATGTAGVALQIAARTDADVVGIDLSEAMLRRGRENAVRRGLDARISLLLGTAESLPFEDEVFDALSFTYLLRYVEDPASTLRELARVVKPGGRVSSLEFFVPDNALFRAGWTAYTRFVLPVLGAAAGRGWYEVGRFLGPSIVDHYERYPLDWQVGAWEQAGLTDVGYTKMTLGAGLVMWGTKSGG
jgi:demethylmenaquinone methyltransferase/2-methoxy-6-polyprenyl-1,4-benzoquinol methylase